MQPGARAKAVGRPRGTRARILIGICSCRRHRDKRAAVRETWLRLLPKGVSAVFFVGRGRKSSERDVISLPVGDDYASLPQKSCGFFAYALRHHRFDYLFKCDDDTYVRAERLFDLLKGAPDFVGSADWWPSHADGGAGYLLSRKAVAIAAALPPPPSGPEDVWVTQCLRAAGIELRPSSQLRHTCRDFPEAHNRLVTAHHCSPGMMKAIHAMLLNRRAGRVLMSFYATHAAWNGPFVLLHNGVFLGGASQPHGRWRLDSSGNSLIIDWFSWPRDALRKTPFGFANSSLRLDLAF